MYYPRIPYRAGWAIPPAANKHVSDPNPENGIEPFFDNLKVGALDKARAQMSENRRLILATGLDGWTALFFAVQFDAAQAAQDFALMGCDVNHADDNGVTPLILAAIAGSLSCVEALLRFDDLDINVECATGATALSTAMELGCHQIARVLLRAGASILLGEHGKTPLDLANKGLMVQRDVQLMVQARYRQLN